MATRRNRTKKTTDAAEVKQEAATTLGEIGGNSSIEPVSEKDFVKASELERFMQDILTIEVHQSNLEGDLDVITPNVNGTNQPIIRGRAQDVKRKYVEALARCRTTTYDQKTPDLSNPANIQMQPKSNLTYPFAVLNDPAPNGREWLQSILNQV